MQSPRIITLTTDFGLSDYYVGAMKAVLLRECPDANLIDITHLIPPQDVVAGAIAVERAVASFFPGTVHLAVVDPGVGTPRRLLIAEIAAQYVVCPDNGLITWAHHRLGGAESHELTWRPLQLSHTFHGRDVMAPVAGKLARGEQLSSVSRPLPDPILLDLMPAEAPGRGRIIHIDHFGNATTNISQDLLAKDAMSVRTGGRNVGLVRNTYADVKPGEAIALVGSSDLLEIAIRDGSAAADLGLRVGDEVEVSGRENPL